MIFERRDILAGLSAAALSISLPAPALARRFGDNDPVDWKGPGPRAYPVHGIDAARFQGRIDWRTVAKTDVKFAWFKATEGGDGLDPEFSRNWRLAGRHRIPRGAYHFYYWCRDADSQAQWFIRNVPRRRGSLPPVLDLEWNPYSPTCTLRPPPATVRSEAKRFIQLITRHYGQRPVIYTTPDFWDRNDIAGLGGDFWLRSTAEPVHKRYRTRNWRFWQYSGTGVVDGIEKEVDLNCFNGTRSDWQRWLKRRQIR